MISALDFLTRIKQPLSAGVSVEQRRDAGQIAAVVNAAALALTAQRK